MDINADIISGHSLAGITLGTSIFDILLELQTNNMEFVESTFANFGKKYTRLDIFDGGVSLVADDTTHIIRLSCGLKYRGKCRKTLYPGMTVKQVCDCSSKQLIIHGMVVVDGDFGVFFEIPEGCSGNDYDGIDYISQLPEGMTLQEMHVMNPEWWR